MAFLTAEEIAELLDEPNVELLARVVEVLGAEQAEAILEDTLRIETLGGLRIENKLRRRRRTPGGVFFYIIKRTVARRLQYRIFLPDAEHPEWSQSLRRPRPRPSKARKKSMVKPNRPLRPIKKAPITVEGVVQMTPMERHTNSVWRVLKTAEGTLVRFTMATTGELTRWVEPGQRVRLVGPMVEKVWKDGMHQTLSGHHAVEILDMAQAV